jgi:hypothetical protein
MFFRNVALSPKYMELQLRELTLHSMFVHIIPSRNLRLKKWREPGTQAPGQCCKVLFSLPNCYLIYEY